MARLIIPTNVGAMPRPIIPTYHVGAMAHRNKGRPIVPTNHIVGKTGIPFFIRIVGITGLSEKCDVGLKDVP